MGKHISFKPAVTVTVKYSYEYGRELYPYQYMKGLEGETRKKVQCSHQAETLIRLTSSSTKILKISESNGSSGLLLYLRHFYS